MDESDRQEAEEAYWTSQLSRDAGAASPHKGIRVRAVIVGVIVDWLATLTMVTVYAWIFLREAIEEYGGFDKVPQQAFSQEDLLAFGLIGTLATALGGYVAGRIARRRRVRHGVLVAAASLLLGLALELALDGNVRLHGWEILFLVLMIPAGAFGGYVAYRLSREVPPPAPGVPTMRMS